MLIVIRAFAAAFDLLFAMSYLFSVSFTLSTIGPVPKDSPILSAVDIAFFLLYYGCLDSGCCGAGTVGKRVLGLEVRTADGSALPLYLSLARTALKFGLPLCLFKLATDLVLIKGFIGVAAALAAMVFLPISVVVGKGTVGLHDILTRTCVLRRGGEYSPVRDRSVYLLTTALATFILALSTSAWIRSMIGLNQTDLRSVANAIDPSAELAKEIVSGKGSEAIRPFVRNVEITPSIEEFPTDYSTSFTKVPPGIVTDLQSKQGAAMVTVELSERGFAQFILRSAIVDRVASVGIPKLVSQRDLPTFIWVAFDAPLTAYLTLYKGKETPWPKIRRGACMRQSPLMRSLARL